MRRTRLSTAPTVSLFPFLAVLLCTMGALILLLVVIARNSHLQAAAIVAQEMETSQAEVELEIEELKWRVEGYQESSRLTLEELKGRRNELAAVEEHISRVVKQLEELARSAQSLNALNNDQSIVSGQSVQELEKIKLQIEQQKELLQQQSQQLQQRKTSYSIVPYHGPNSTQRRPFYIECHNDKIILQPEGIEFTVDDFAGEIGPSNPLATAIRAGRDYLAGLPNFSEAGEPYPLLIVRPDGIAGYHVARVACASWGSEFGYEFVDEDWDLKYPDRDPGLAQAQQAAVSLARERQVQRTPVVSGAFARRSRATYRATDSIAGIVQESAGSGESSDAPSGRNGRSPSSLSSIESTTPENFQRNQLASPGQRNSYAAREGAFNAGTGAASGAGSSEERAFGSSQATSSGETGAFQGGYASVGDSAAGSSSLQAGNSISEMQGGHLNTAQSSGSQAQGGTAQNNSPYGSAQAMASQGASAERGSMSGQRSSSGQPGGTSGEVAGSSSESGANSAQASSTVQSLSQKRGQNWGLPQEAVASRPSRRPILIVCRSDQLVVMPDKGSTGGQSISLGPHTADAVDELVHAVWVHTRAWGLAGPGMYWHPELILEVGSSGEQRYRELSRLLEGSGLEVRRTE